MVGADFRENAFDRTVGPLFPSIGSIAIPAPEIAPGKADKRANHARTGRFALDAFENLAGFQHGLPVISRDAARRFVDFDFFHAAVPSRERFFQFVKKIPGDIFGRRIDVQRSEYDIKVLVVELGQ